MLQSTAILKPRRFSLGMPQRQPSENCALRFKTRATSAPRTSLCFFPLSASSASVTDQWQRGTHGRHQRVADEYGYNDFSCTPDSPIGEQRYLKDDNWMIKVASLMGATSEHSDEIDGVLSAVRVSLGGELDPRQCLSQDQEQLRRQTTFANLAHGRSKFEHLHRIPTLSDLL